MTQPIDAKGEKPAAARKVWNRPVLEQLTVDLSAIRQKSKSKVDGKGVGAFS